MEAKLRQLMKHEGINSSRLAEILGIQASGISHIMSGRNKPSYDFLLKLLQRFPQINPDWLLLDKGPMYRDEIKNKNGAPASGGRGGGAMNGSTGGGSVGAQGGSYPATDSMAGSGSGGVAGGMGYGANSQGEGMTGSGDFGISRNAPSDVRGVAGGMRAGMVGGGLFGPDNDDIIRGGTPSASGTGSVRQANTQTDTTPSRGGYATSSPGAPQTPPSQPQSGQTAAGLPVYQTSSFTYTASIERIVVFYRDKTFSEYQPE